MQSILKTVTNLCISIESQNKKAIVEEDEDASYNETSSDDYKNKTDIENTSQSKIDKSNNIVILNRDVTRGGVKVDTGRDSKSGYIISRLSLANAQITDIGNYTCRLSSWPSERPNMRGLHDTISVHVLQGENTEAIQQESNSATRTHIVLTFDELAFYSVFHQTCWILVYMTPFTLYLN